MNKFKILIIAMFCICNSFIFAKEEAAELIGSWRIVSMYMNSTKIENTNGVLIFLKDGSGKAFNVDTESTVNIIWEYDSDKKISMTTDNEEFEGYADVVNGVLIITGIQNKKNAFVIVLKKE